MTSVGGSVGESVGGSVGLSVGGSVGESVGGSVGESVGESVGGSVGGSMEALWKRMLQTAFRLPAQMLTSEENNRTRPYLQQ